MRIALVNQAFHPDVVSSGQHLTDLALQLVQRGHDVTVVTSRRAYDDPTRTFARTEIWRGIRIYRVFNTGFGKHGKWTRAADFATFIACCCLRLCLLPRQDLVIGMTSPPLVAVFAAWFARLRGSHFVYWVMDLNPDEAVAAGWLDPHSLLASALERLSRFSLARAARIIALDRFMQNRICAKGVPAAKIKIIPPWSHDTQVKFDPDGRSDFRRAHGLENKFLVMYSGNHSPCHPLDTVLGAARRLAANPDIAFCFVGGGSEFNRVRQFAHDQRLKNILCLPYQPLERLAAALSAADLHLVLMGNPFVGLVHPCKVYNILRVGAPLLYIGPVPSHISELLDTLDGSLPHASLRHGDVEGVSRVVLNLKQAFTSFVPERRSALPVSFSKDSLLPGFVTLLESTVNQVGDPECAAIAGSMARTP